MLQVPVPGRVPAVEKHCSRGEGFAEVSREHFNANFNVFRNKESYVKAKFLSLKSTFLSNYIIISKPQILKKPLSLK